MSQQINQTCASFMHVLPSDIILVIRSFLVVPKLKLLHEYIDLDASTALYNEQPITIGVGIIAMGGYMEDR